MGVARSFKTRFMPLWQTIALAHIRPLIGRAVSVPSRNLPCVNQKFICF
jgi:hypothetical protein